MPLTKKGKKIKRAMRKQYGSEWKKVFYASKNKGTISGVDEMKLINLIITRLEEQEKRDPATDFSQHLQKKGQPRHGHGTPSRLEKTLGIYLPGRGRRGVTPNVGAGVTRTFPQRRHGRSENDPASGFTRIRPEDKPSAQGGGSGNRRAMVRSRKGQMSGFIRSGGLKRLRRKLKSKTYTADKGSLQRAISQRLASGARRLKRGFSNLPQGK